ncbi:epoxide hydrolase family protein [Devosia ginsengisoli]|uniref:epoxide hydrolase family protein n=1 Tax=Devosia ginsengisoli TaxID=400770 RepID=UPI0026EF58E6|nr:epoxide hydrolase family protein [Devosia ginsengisoli]MCR6673788.1 epoxide hydrolase [Devosia ginsengisoli]
MTDITPFKIAIDAAQLDDLHQRLRNARFPDSFSRDWSHGQPVHFIRELAEQWLNSYDWRAWETRLNAYPQFLTEIDGQTIHFLHVRSPEPDAIPLVLTHGWPSSFVEYLPVIGPLTDPKAHGKPGAQAFHLVIPSLPGYGFSTPLAGPGWEPVRTAAAWDVLMKRLGYASYGAQGGDAGALVSRELAILNPEGLIGVHLQQVFAFPSGAPGEMDTLSPFELAGFANLEKFQKYNGYADIQSKRPGTLAYGLVDSPVAQLAWNAELFFGFEGEAATSFDRELFLTNTAIFWFTASGSGQGNFFLEGAQTGGGYREIPTAVPTAVASFANDFRSVRTFAERSFSNIVQWTEMESGGHFAAADASEALVADMQSFFSQLR